MPRGVSEARIVSISCGCKDIINDLIVERDKWKAKAELFFEIIEDVGRDAQDLCSICKQKDNDRCFMCGVSCRKWELDTDRFNLD